MTEVVWPCEDNERRAHSEKNARYGHLPGKRSRGRSNLRWKDACKRDMIDVGLKHTHTNAHTHTHTRTHVDLHCVGRQEAGRQGGRQGCSGTYSFNVADSF